MNRSETISALASAISKAQAEFVKVPKNKTATVRTKTGGEYKYKYADLADCLAMALPVLAKHKIAFQQPHVIVDGKLRVVTLLLHESGEWMQSDGIEISEAGDPQQFGAESTYFRRYDGCSMLGIAPDEDTDAQQAAQRTTPKAETVAAPAAKSNPKECAAFFRRAKEKGVDLHVVAKRMQERFETKQSSDLTVEQLDSLLNDAAESTSFVPPDVATMFDSGMDMTP